ncbi:MAG: hypothetical protein MHM6MM_008042, partial [Cercozoa sp. M6MM]
MSPCTTVYGDAVWHLCRHLCGSVRRDEKHDVAVKQVLKRLRGSRTRRSEVLPSVPPLSLEIDGVGHMAIP